MALPRKNESFQSALPGVTSHFAILGLELTPDTVTAWQERAGARRVLSLAPGVFRLQDVTAARGFVEAAQAAGLDAFHIDRPMRWSDFQVLAMDMDSTLITIECIDEIADFAGVKPQVAAVTAAAMRGELNFPEALRQRVALLKGVPESALEQVYEHRLRLSPGADQLLAFARKAGLATVLVSGGFTFFTGRLQARLGLGHTLANVLEIQRGRLTGRVLGDIVDADAKAAKVRAVCTALGCGPERALVIGDGANDLKMMAPAGLSVAYHAKAVVRAQAGVSIVHAGLDALQWRFEE